MNDLMRIKPYRGPEAYIFLSYAHKDNDLIAPITQRMIENGYRVWFDEGIDPGTEWDQQIANRIEECGYFIAFISQNYLNSDNCRDEINYARDLRKERLLVYIEDVQLPSGMAMRLGRLQSIHQYKYSDQRDFFEKLFSAAHIKSCQGEVQYQPKPTAIQSAKSAEGFMKTKSQQHSSVFISYKSEEASVAYQVRTALLQNGISCWMAPDSIPIGSNYGREILNAIAQCEVFLLLLSECAQKSVRIANELDQAFSCRKLILPIHLDESALAPGLFSYYLAGIQRIEAFGRFNEAMDCVVRWIHTILGTDMSQDSEAAAEMPTENQQNDAASPEESLDAAALYKRGEDYYYGRGVPQDYSEAAKWFRRAAEQGNAPAQFNLGIMFDNGRGVPQDYGEAIKWYRLAAEQGNALAQYNLGLMYYFGQGVSQDYGEALKWFRLAAEQGNAHAQYNLGVMYYNGEGISPDFSETVKWYRRAAEQGHASAQYNLGVMYKNGQGVSQDYSEAAKWYRQAAEQGNADAQYSLAVIYKNGEGVQRDYNEAVKWYGLAAGQGHAKAKKELKALLRKM